MAKMLQDTIIIDVAKLLKNDADQSELLTSEMVDQLEAVLAEIIGDSTAMIEVTKVDAE